MTTTKQQRAAICRLYQRDPDGSANYRAFRRRVVPGYDCLMIQWCHMWIGIEPDGYTHS